MAAIYDKYGIGISIHALREEGDAPLSGPLPVHHIFLSTPSARRATGSEVFPTQETENFYPRPPRGGRRSSRDFLYSSMSISIHALREEGDQEELAKKTDYHNFYPRPPRGGRPKQGGRNTASVTFLSTPSARRATSGSFPRLGCPRYFYPRPPRGGRP